MAKTNRLGELRAKAALYDELVERLTDAEDELDRLRHSRAPVAPGRPVDDRVDPGWREIANDLAGALRPYTLFKEQAVEDGRIVVRTRGPGLDAEPGAPGVGSAGPAGRGRVLPP